MESHGFSQETTTLLFPKAEDVEEIDADAYPRSCFSKLAGKK